MDADQVRTFCDVAQRLQPQLAQYVATEPDKRTPEDDAMVRQLRLSVAALFNVMVEVARMTPPPMRPMPPPVLRQ
jgi:hypothetical protein